MILLPSKEYLCGKTVINFHISYHPTVLTVIEQCWYFMETKPTALYFPGSSTTKLNPQPLNNFYFYLLCVHAVAGLWRSGDNFGRRFSLSTTGVAGIKLKSPGLGSKHIWSLNHLAGPRGKIFKTEFDFFPTHSWKLERIVEFLCIVVSGHISVEDFFSDLAQIGNDWGVDSRTAFEN